MRDIADIADTGSEAVGTRQFGSDVEELGATCPMDAPDCSGAIEHTAELRVLARQQARVGTMIAGDPHMNQYALTAAALCLYVAGDSLAQNAPPKDGSSKSSEAVVECLRAADEELLIEDALARQLCAMAQSTAPVTCFQDGDDRTLLETRSLVELCTCAQSTAPIDCFERADDVDLTDRERVRMCSASCF